MNLKRIPLVLLVLSIASCQSAHEPKQESQNTIAAEHEEHDHEHSQPIELNNGKKWKVEPKMMEFIQNMENATMTISSGSIPAHQELAEYLDAQLDSLTSNCTMTGQAHDELHKWLLPFIYLSNLYLNEEDSYEKTQLYKKIIASFGEFNRYFE